MVLSVTKVSVGSPSGLGRICAGAGAVGNADCPCAGRCPARAVTPDTARGRTPERHCFPEQLQGSGRGKKAPVYLRQDSAYLLPGREQPQAGESPAPTREAARGNGLPPL